MPQKTGITLRNPPKLSNPRKPPLRSSRQTDKPEQRRSRQAMIEHLQENAIERGGLGRGRSRVDAGELRKGEDPQETVTKVVDRRIGQHALEILLRKGRAGGEDN